MWKKLDGQVCLFFIAPITKVDMQLEARGNLLLACGISKVNFSLNVNHMY